MFQKSKIYMLPSFLLFRYLGWKKVQIYLINADI